MAARIERPCPLVILLRKMSAAIEAQPPFDATDLVSPLSVRCLTKGIRDCVAKHLVERDVYECSQR